MENTPHEELTAPYDIDALYEEVDALLSRIPKELSATWQDEFDCIDDDNISQFRDKVVEFLKRRESALETMELRADLSPRVKEEVMYVLNVIRDTFGDANYFLGNGYTAEVYELPVAPHVAVKYISKQDAYNENNHLRAEYEFLRISNDLKVGEHGRIRTPKADFIRIHPTEGHQMGQEKVRGKSLTQLIETPEHPDCAKLIELARTIDRESLMNDAVEFVTRLYDEHGLTHNDLFTRNLMLDDRGRLFVIDFGKAKEKELGNDWDHEHTRDLVCIKVALKRFFAFLDGQEIPIESSPGIGEAEYVDNILI